MKLLFLRILLSGLAIVIAAYLIPWVTVDTYWTAIIVAIVLALVNWLLGRILDFLTIPLNLITLWLVSLIISVLMILLTDSLVAWFSTWWFFWAAVFWIVLAIINMIFGIEKDQ
jgi:putative membrane protein